MSDLISQFQIIGMMLLYSAYFTRWLVVSQQLKRLKKSLERSYPFHPWAEAEQAQNKQGYNTFILIKLMDGDEHATRH